VDDARIKTILATSPTMAVIGIRDDPSAAGFYVPEYLHDVGYRILGVNPRLAGQTLFGEPVRASLAEVTEPYDLVDVFRRADQLHVHVDELIAAHPKVVWFQLGIRNDAVAAQLEAAGIEVIQDRCTLADHQRLRLGAPEKTGR
jgi:predicted CoA-binding protein